jgi:hypothetical protein
MLRNNGGSKVKHIRARYKMSWSDVTQLEAMGIWDSRMGGVTMGNIGPVSAFILYPISSDIFLTLDIM